MLILILILIFILIFILILVRIFLPVGPVTDGQGVPLAGFNFACLTIAVLRRRMIQWVRYHLDETVVEASAASSPSIHHLIPSPLPPVLHGSSSSKHKTYRKIVTLAWNILLSLEEDVLADPLLDTPNAHEAIVVGPGDVDLRAQVSELLDRPLVNDGCLEGDVRVVIEEFEADVVASDGPILDLGPVEGVHVATRPLAALLGDGLRALHLHLGPHAGQQAEKGE
ncbi:hypothetical protein PGQ11_006709 [Apiospora arundinis]|uniref:Secreted protein n=1 Tax=Apiospora arundinis TaxID=335852 RepID=A0ABR2ITM8_9PEZI